MTSRERVFRCLRFQYPDRMPYDLWYLPWAKRHLDKTLKEIMERWPSDFCQAPTVYRPSAKIQGDVYAVGQAIDEWGCFFTNIHEGVHGQVKKPLLSDIAEWRSVQPPWEILPEDYGKARDTIARAAEEDTRFMLSRGCPRPWERYQFIRGSENALIDIMEFSADVCSLLNRIHEFYLKELEFWATTAVDGVMFMDDWGTQHSLLIAPAIWRNVFKPMYRDYCEIAQSHGKAVFMHSDGYTLDILPDLIEIGVDAVNLQLFCMDLAQLAQIGKGRITFWGEIDRQHVLPSPDPEVGRKAVRYVAQHLYDPSGGIIAQFELTPGSHGPTAIAIFEEWDRVMAEWKPFGTLSG